MWKTEDNILDIWKTFQYLFYVFPAPLGIWNFNKGYSEYCLAPRTSQEEYGRSCPRIVCPGCIISNPSLVHNFHKESQYDGRPWMIHDCSFLDELVEYVLFDQWVVWSHGDIHQLYICICNWRVWNQRRTRSSSPTGTRQLNAKQDKLKYLISILSCFLGFLISVKN